MTIDELFAGVPVTDIAAARAWYERMLGRPADMLPNDTEAVWRAATGGGWLYVVVDPERAGHALLTLLVDDLDAALAELATRGLSAGPVQVLSETVRKAVVTDPDGNSLAFGQAG